MTDISHIEAFLLCETPQAWLDNALSHIPLLLIDHANCELKAAQTAQSLMWKYGMDLPLVAAKDSRKKAPRVALNLWSSSLTNYELLNKMSRLAREELRHFEQVIAIMRKRGIDYVQIDASRYAAELRKCLRTSEPHKLIDTLIMGAIIEARSCERFARLAPLLDGELQQFYLSLLKSEARHYLDYLNLAKKIDGKPIDDRVNLLLSAEKQLIEADDQLFRFHSGPVRNIE
jgi:tRNA-(ms[2]io[6]A)-hydroxylase